MSELKPTGTEGLSAHIEDFLKSKDLDFPSTYVCPGNIIAIVASKEHIVCSNVRGL